MKFIPGDETLPIVWKRPGIVKLVLLPTVGGLIKRPLRLVLDVPRPKSVSLVVEIWLIVTEVALRNRTEAGMTVPSGAAKKSIWNNWSFSLFTWASRSATYVVVDCITRVGVKPPL